jgi:two-component system response regulator (stage 0 sporulation protein A)
MVVIISTHDFASKVRSSIELISKEVSIKHIASDYNEGLKIINERNSEIDAIIIDASLDGNILSLLHNYKEENMLSKTIVIDNIKLGCYNLIESKYQLYNVIPHNFRIEDLLMYIKDIKEKNEKVNYQKLATFDEIAEILKTLGVAPDKNGFHYLRKAIYECYLNPKLLTSVTKEVYPLVGKTFDKTPNCVERSIRSAIETGWDRSDYEYTEKLFLNCIDFYRSKPTNGEFISIIVDKLLLQDGKINY